LLRGLTFWLLLALLVASVAPAGERLRREMSYRRHRDRSGPNVVVFSVDTLRADSLSYYGGGLATPGLDRLVARGVVFRDAQTVAPATGPSFSSMMTSRYPQEHGITTSAMVLPAAEDTMAELLRAGGYATAAVVSAFVLDARYGLDAGFETYDDSLRSRYRSSIDEKDPLSVVERASEWLADHGDEKFFLWLHLFGPHSPYRCWDADLGSSLELDDAWVAAVGRRLMEGDQSAQADRRVIRDCYRTEVALVDAALASLFDQLEGRGLLDDTLIMFTADHGETLGDRDGYFGHVASLHREVLRVPLIVAFPGASPGGRSVDTPVSTLDVLPTVLDVAGIDPPHRMRGVSLRSFVDDPAGGARTMFAVGPSDYWLEKGQAFAVREGAWKLIEHERAADRLYNLSEDPYEQRDLSAERPAEYRRLKTTLDRWKRVTGYRASLANPILWLLAGWKNRVERAVGLAPETLDPRGLDDDEIRQLRALGYLR
jgi:arylsulfatase A-like enzyme